MHPMHPMHPATPADTAQPKNDRVRSCVVCAADVPPDLDACPSCHEPTLRWCSCLRAVWIDERACPACGRVLPRYPTLGARAKVQRQKVLLVAGLVLVPLVALGVAFGPRLMEMSSLASRRSAGMEAAAEGRNPEAIRHLMAWVTANPEDAEALAALGRAELATGDPAGARELQRALLADAALPGVHITLAEHFAASGDMRSAFDHAIAAPEPAAHRIGARAARALRLSEEATRLYDKAVAAFPTDVDLAAEAATAHAEAGALRNSARHSARSRELWETVAGRLRASGATTPDRAALLARALAGAGDAGAADAFAAALRLAPADTALRIEAYRARLAAGDPAGARAILDDAAAGTSREWRITLARELVGSGPPDGLPASPSAPKTTGLDPAAAARRAAAEDAVTSMRALLAGSPGDVDASAVLVRALTLLGRHAEAQAAAEPALRAATARNPEIFAAAGDADMAAGDRVGAARHYGAWRVVAPTDPAPLRRIVSLGIDELCAIRRAPGTITETDAALASAAEKALSDLRALQPDTKDVLRWDAVLCDAGGQHREADRMLARLTELGALDPPVRSLRFRRACDGTGLPDAARLASSPPPDGIAGPNVDPEELQEFCARALHGGHAAVVEPLAAQAVARLPQDAALRRALATARIVLGRFDDAAACLDPADPVVAGDDDLVELRIVARALAGRLDALDAEFVAADALGAGRPGGRIVGAGFAIAGDAGRAAALLATGGVADESVERRRERAERLDDAGLGDLAREIWATLADAPASDGTLRARALAALLDGSTPGSAPATALRQRATEAASRLATGSPDDRAAGVYLTAVIAAREGDREGAVSMFRRAAAARPDFLDTDLRVGTALASLGRPAEAVERLGAHVATRPGAVAARRLLVEQFAALGVRQIAAGDNDHARASFAAARRHALPEIDAANRRTSRPSTGLLGFGLPPHAVTALAANAPRVAADAPASAAFAVVIADAGRTEQALGIAQELLALDPDRPWPWIVRGVVRLAGRNTTAALDDFGEAEQRGEKFPEFRTARALALLLAGRRTEAIADVGVALELAPSDRFAATVAAALGGAAATPETLRAADEAWAAEIRAAADPR